MSYQRPLGISEVDKKYYFQGKMFRTKIRERIYSPVFNPSVSVWFLTRVSINISINLCLPIAGHRLSSIPSRECCREHYVISPPGERTPPFFWSPSVAPILGLTSPSGDAKLNWNVMNLCMTIAIKLTNN